MAGQQIRTFLNDGAHYDALFAALDEDLAFWTRCAVGIGGPVLELACGTGRVALAMAEVGVEVVGIDISAAFLERAQHKSVNRDLRVAWLRADVRDFSLGRRFRLVAFPFRSVAVLPTIADVDACFSCVRRHLDQEGLFVLDAFNLSPMWPTQRTRSFSYADPAGGGAVQVVEERRYDPGTRVETVQFTFPGAPVANHRAELQLGLHTGTELKAALEANGFALTGHFGNYDETPYFEAAPYQILIAKAA